MDKPNKNKIVKVTVLVMLMIFSINLVSAELNYSTGEAIYGTLADGTPDYGGNLTTYDGIDFTYSNVGTLAYIKPRINPSNYESELLFGLLNDILKIQSTGIFIIGDIHINNDSDILGDSYVGGDLNVTGTISNSLSHMHSLSTQIGVVSAIDTWYNITFNASLGDVENLEFLTDNRTLVIDHDGHYTIGFGMGFQDDSPSPNADVGMRLTRNGIEIPGSYIESDTTKQNSDVWAEHTTHAELSAGDMINMQYISSDTDVTIEQHDTYATQPFNAYGYLQEVIV